MRLREGNLRKVLADIFGEHFPIMGDQFRINCINPDCTDTRGNLEINMKKGVFHCWLCDYSGTIYELLKDYLGWVPKIEKYSTAEDLRQTRDIESIIKESEVQPAKKSIDYSILPKEYVYLGQPIESLSMLGRKALKYALSRMSKEDIIQHKIGYCGLGKYKWRIIVPFFEDERVVYFIARTFMGKDRPYDNPKREEIGTGKEEVVFNIDLAQKLGQAVICEGVFDAIRVGLDGTAILGVSISDGQFVKFLHMKKIYIMLDADAKKHAIEIARRFKNAGKEVCVINLEHGDPDNYSRQEVRNMVVSAKPFNLLDEILN